MAHTKFPKQLRYWLRKNKIKITYADKHCIYAISNDPRRFGFNRQFRFLAEKNLFQISDDNFDRWANSLMVEYTIPQSEAIFNDLLDDVFFDEYPDQGALHIDIEHSWHDCEDCGYFVDTMVVCSNGDQYFRDGHIGSDRFMIADFYWNEDNAREIFTEFYRARGYRVKVAERYIS
uniref:Uncharacterized protein n=1 Tax=Ochrobactrum phage ORM_20 TaxID=2985243 RepID=A0A9N6WV94_9VIRU|nr:hypothetical protein ORM20_00044 [Ochrobactrum phage ORM_20]